MRNYKDLMVWEKAHKLTLAIYRETNAFPKEERFGLTSQVRRASSSIPANLAGGLWSAIRWRDGQICPDRDGIRC
jgi:hypothetical protein